MAELTVGEIKKGRLHVAKIEQLALTAPDIWIEIRLHRLAAKARQRYNWSPELKRQYVLKFIRERLPDDPCTRADIMAHFDWNKNEVTALVQGLVDDGLVERIKVRPAGQGPGAPINYLRAIIPNSKS